MQARRSSRVSASKEKSVSRSLRSESRTQTPMDNARLQELAQVFAAKSGFDGRTTLPKDMAKAHFYCHGSTVAKYDKEKEKCHRCQFTKFTTHRSYPISLRNDVDDEVLPAWFKFVDSVVPSANIPLTEEAFISSCECDGLLCLTSECSCLSDIDTETLPGYKMNAYHATGQLRSAYLEGSYPIYECGPNCRCGDQCPNRVVQKGRRIPLEIFRTRDGRGWGMSSLLFY